MTTQEPARRFRREIAADLDELRPARRWLVGCLAYLAPRERSLASDLELVLGEILSNSIRHAYAPGEKGRIEVGVELGSGEVILTVRDYGRAMDPASYRKPDLAVPHEGGYGIFLVGKLADEMKIESPEGVGNLVTVRRLVRGPAAAEPAGELG